MISLPVTLPIAFGPDDPLLTHLITAGAVGGGGFVPIDADARAYVAAVEIADNQKLEDSLKRAIDELFLGCKADASLNVGVSNWDAMKAACLMIGPRTLAGSLIPLKGTAPTNFNFVAADYNRLLGLQGNAVDKYISSNRNNNADPAANKHLAVWVSKAGAGTRTMIGNGASVLGDSQLNYEPGSTRYTLRLNYSVGLTITTGAVQNDFAGMSRVGNTVYHQFGALAGSTANTGTTPTSGIINVFRRGSTLTSDDILGFYSIGEAIDLALMRGRLQSYVAAISAAVPPSISLEAPGNYQVFQRNGSNQASIQISGRYVGAPTAIEARWNGGSWSTISASPSGGSFSGVIPNQSVGQGELEVRFANDSAITAKSVFVGIGEVFLCAGQSNMSGRGDTNQTPFHGTWKAGLFGNDYRWKELVDPYDSSVSQADSVSSDTGAAGSAAVRVASLLMDSLNVPVALIPAAKGGSSITAWQPNANRVLRSTLYGSANYRAQLAGGVRCVLWWQGETDAEFAMAEATYNTNFDNVANAFAIDRGVLILPVLLQNCSGATAPAQLAINNAILTAISDNANVAAGADLRDLTTDDTFHLKIDSKIAIAAERIHNSILAKFFA